MKLKLHLDNSTEGSLKEESFRRASVYSSL